MSSNPLPEVATLIEIVSRIRMLESANAQVQQRPALGYVASIYAEVADDSVDNLFFGISEIIEALEQILPTISPPTVRQVASGVLSKIRLLFSPRALQLQSGQYWSIVTADITFVEGTIGLFLGTGFDIGPVLDRQVEIASELENLRGHIGKSDEVSDSIKTVLLAQVDLIEKSMARLKSAGVGPFKESVYSLFGRVSIEIANPKTAGSGDLRKVADDLLRIVGLIEAGGKLLQLSGIDPLKMLGGPGA